MLPQSTAVFLVRAPPSKAMSCCQYRLFQIAAEDPTQCYMHRISMQTEPAVLGMPCGAVRIYRRLLF